MMFSALVMATFYTLYGFAVDRMGLQKARLAFAVLLPGIGLAFKVMQSISVLGDVEPRHLSKR
ncbi:hypothetical protein [Thermococcus pacificus]|uniref:Major facilitator superfamily (MFS) profile domain-containing protein n=1 Tax=Thermococcus pacificus TaxID=71998 RepID=A0A218P8Y4_9EURY|nr:hypothetical protein [Thermococcus pacificus]ASJ07244.1 hypothetical protein A3L08_07880 [Thermococcus pacificus]